MTIVIGFAAPCAVTYGTEAAEPLPADSLYSIGVDLYKAGDHAGAIPYLESAADRYAHAGEYHPGHASACKILGYCHFVLDNYPEAIHFLEILKDETLQNYGENHPDYVSACHYIGESHLLLENYEPAARSFELELSSREVLSDSTGMEYANSCTALAVCYHNLKNDADAVRLESRAAKLLARHYGTSHLKYAGSCNLLSKYHAALNNFAEAVRYGIEAAGIYHQLPGSEHDYATICGNIAVYHAELANYSEAIRYNLIAMDILDDRDPKYEIVCSNLASCHSKIGDYTSAIHYATVSLEISEERLGASHPFHAVSCNNLAGYYAAAGDYGKAIDLGLKACETTGAVHGENSPEFASSCNNLSLYYHKLGNNAEALRFASEACCIQKLVLGTDHPSYAISCNNLASCHASSGNYDEAILLTRKALEINRSVLGEHHPECAVNCNNLSCYLMETGKYREAIEYSATALEITGLVFGKSHPDFATGCNNMAAIFSELGDYDEAAYYQETATEIWRNTFGDNHPSYIAGIGNLAMYCFRNSDLEKARDYERQYIGKLIHLVKRSFSFLTKNEQYHFWNTHKGVFEIDLPQFAFIYNTPEMLETAYNGCLLSKGLLLNSEIEMRRLFLESGDATVLKLYDETARLHEQLETQLEKPIAQRYVSIDSISREIASNERMLVNKSKAYGDYTHKLAVDFQHVRDRLGDRDMAIEFVAVPELDKEFTIYIALILKKGFRSPKMIKLFKGPELAALKNICDERLDDLVWTNLTDELEGIENVYFSPAAELYNIPIEWLPGRLNDGRNYYRLSSTRELVMTKNTLPLLGNTIVYGGLKFDTDRDTLISDGHRHACAIRGMTVGVDLEALGLRAGVNPLPGTGEEAKYLYDKLRGCNSAVRLFTKSKGTESSFKALSGSRVSMIHIGTHGFYWSETEARMRRNLTFLKSTQSSYNSIAEDKALTRSGLLLAGANNALAGIHLPEGVDDGILTAHEIAQLDLRGLDLVVLSACQTALGEVTGDGVYGLQRGFKKAGANSLMMSLWKVDDKATQLLMNRFYDNLIDRKMSKFESLKEAQRFLREYEDVVADGNGTHRVYPYAQPYFWAGFILLDAAEGDAARGPYY